MSKHSPGPWSVSESRPYDVRDASGELVVANCGCGPPDNVADVRLIAAAPDLLELVSEIAMSWDLGEDDTRNWFHDRASELLRLLDGAGNLGPKAGPEQKPRST